MLPACPRAERFVGCPPGDQRPAMAESAPCGWSSRAQGHLGLDPRHGTAPNPVVAGGFGAFRACLKAQVVAHRGSLSAVRRNILD